MKPSRYVFWILILAAALRIYGLGSESLWLDEGGTFRRINLNVGEIRTDGDSGTQAPLYFMVTKAWCAVAGTSEFALRFPAMLFGLFSVFAIYHLGRKLLNASAGAWAAFFLAINPFAIFYSQDARPYILFLLGSIISWYYLIRLLRQVRLNAVIGYLVSTVAVFYTHPFGGLLILTHLAAFLIYRRVPGFRAARRAAKQVLGIFGIALLLYVPQISIFVGSFSDKIDGNACTNWIPSPGFHDLWIPLAQYFMDPKLTVAAILIVGLAALFRFLTNPQARPVLFFGIAVWVCFVLLPWLISVTVTPILVYRYTIPLLTFVILFLSWAISGLEAMPQRIVAGLLIVLSLFPLYHYYTGIDKDPWREAYSMIRDDLHGGDVIVLDPAFTRDVFDYYFELPGGIRVVEIDDETNLGSSLKDARRVWIVRSYRSPYAKSELLDLRMRSSYETIREEHIKDSLPQNPYAYWIADVRVSLYTPAVAEGP